MQLGLYDRSALPLAGLNASRGSLQFMKRYPLIWNITFDFVDVDQFGQNQSSPTHLVFLAATCQSYRKHTGRFRRARECDFR
jgi:hypothetical protein